MDSAVATGAGLASAIRTNSKIRFRASTSLPSSACFTLLTMEQVEFLRRAGCDRVQGYLLGHPVENATATEHPLGQPQSRAAIVIGHVHS